MLPWQTFFLPSTYIHTYTMQTRYKLYEKDLDFSYKPFLSILGTGLVTANGAHWQRQRILMAPALRVDMLDAILPIARRAADRLADKLQTLCDAAAAAASTTARTHDGGINIKNNNSKTAIEAFNPTKASWSTHK